MQIREVIDLAAARPWGRLPWAQPLLERLPHQVATATTRWDLTIEHPYDDGAGLPVLAVRAGDRPAVLVLDGVGRDLDQQVGVLEAADGNGFVMVLEYDRELGVALLERLGAPLAQTTPDPQEQTFMLCDLLEHCWRLPLSIAGVTAPAHKAQGLRGIVQDALEDDELAREHSDLLERAVQLAEELAGTPQQHQVVVHGDPHSLNALLRPATGHHVMIDPDGFRCEPEYDAGVVLRDLAAPIEHLERTEGPGAGRRWHAELTRRVARRLDLDHDRVAAWALLERVTTGAHLRRLGYIEESRSWLALAARMQPAARM